MNQPLLVNGNEKQPVLAGEIAALNKISEEANCLVASVKNFFNTLFVISKNKTYKKVNKIFLQPENKNITANCMPVCSDELKVMFRESICVENKLMEVVDLLNTTSAGNHNQFKIVESVNHFVSANRNALRVVLKSLLFFLNEKNHQQQVQLEVFEDIDYIVIVAKHKGMPLLRSELKKIYQTSPLLISEFGNTMLYTCWHLLKAIGGWLTTGDNDGTSYVSIGLPK